MHSIAFGSDWKNAAGGDYSVPANWSAGVPNSAVDATFPNFANTDYTVSLSAASAAKNFVVNTAGSLLTLNTSGFTEAVSDLQFGDNGRLAVTGGGTVAVSTAASVNQASTTGTFALTVRGAATTVTYANQFYPGFLTGSNSSVVSLEAGGQLNVASGLLGFVDSNFQLKIDGANSKLTATGPATTEEDNGLDFFRGTIQLTNGGQIASTPDVFLGDSTGQQSTTINGTGSQLSTSKNLVLGNGRIGSDYSSFPRPKGTMALTSGAKAGTTSTTGGEVAIGAVGGIGIVTVDGAGSELLGNVAVAEGNIPTLTGSGVNGGPGTVGTLNVTNGGTVDNLTNVGDQGGVGTVTVDGATSSIKSATLVIGNANLYTNQPANSGYDLSKGTLSVTNGAKVTASNVTYVGAYGGLGILNLGKADGTDSGSTLTTPNLGIAFQAAQPVGAPTPGGTVNVYAGGVLAIKNPATGVYGTLTAYQSAGNTIVDTINLAGGTIDAGSVILPTSSTLNWTSGTLRLRGGSLDVQDATRLNVPSGGTLAGSALVQRDVTVLSGGVLSPGDDASATTGVVHFRDNLTLNSGSALIIDIGGLAAGTQYDQIQDDFTININGNLNIRIINGFQPVVGQTFYILDSTGFNVPVGRFANGTGVGSNFFTDNRGDTYQANYLAINAANNSDPSISLTVVSIPEPSLALAGLATAALLSGRRRTGAQRACLKG